MQTYDRYILRLFAKVLLVCLISITGVYIVVDAFNNLDEFLRYGRQQGGLFRVLADYYLDPITYAADAVDAADYLIVRTVVEGVDKRARNIETIEDLKRDSIDFYARVRSLYRQSRINEINNGVALEDTPTPGLYSFGFETDDEEKSEGDSN